MPILCLRGLSTGDFGPALGDLLGEDASGLWSSSIQRAHRAEAVAEVEVRHEAIPASSGSNCKITETVCASSVR